MQNNISLGTSLNCNLIANWEKVLIVAKNDNTHTDQHTLLYIYI